MRQIFEAELRALGEGLETMSGLVQQSITKAGVALTTTDLAIAEEVIADDAAIDRIEEELDERCVRLLAQQQPVATDLRVVVSGLRISASLERMGDLARHIAEVARGRYPRHAVPPHLSQTFVEMDAAAVRLSKRLVELIDTRDLAVAAAIEADDDLLDELHEDNFTALLGSSWTGSAQEAIDVTLLSRYYERFGDHGVSVARRISYLVTGEVRGSAVAH